MFFKFCNSIGIILFNINDNSNNRKSEGYPKNSIVNIGQNTAKSPGDGRRLAVTQTPLKIYLGVMRMKR